MKYSGVILIVLLFLFICLNGSSNNKDHYQIKPFNEMIDKEIKDSLYKTVERFNEVYLKCNKEIFLQNGTDLNGI